MKKYLVGSQLLNLSNNHDKDMLVVVNDNNVEYYERKYVNGEDIVYRSIANIERQMNFGLPLNRETARYYIINYQLDKDIIGQDFPYEYHILDRRTDYINLLNDIANNNWCNFTKKVFFNGKCLSKLLYHIAYLTFIVENNSTALTAEQQAIVQKIHDKEMPQDYLDVLFEKIRNLK